MAQRRSPAVALAFIALFTTTYSIKTKAEEPAATPPPATEKVETAPVPPVSKTADGATTETATAPTTPAASASPKPAIAGKVEQSGISFGFSPLYKPKVSSDLGGSFSSGFELGLRMSPYFLISARVARGTLTSLGLADGTIVLRPSHTLVGILVGGDIPVTAPNFLADCLQVIAPVGFITYMNWVSARGEPYTNLVGDLYAGAGLRLNLGKLFIDLAPIYHVGITLKDLEQSPGVGLTSTSGTAVKGSTTGFELRSVMTLMFN